MGEGWHKRDFSLEELRSLVPTSRRISSQKDSRKNVQLLELAQRRVDHLSFVLGHLLLLKVLSGLGLPWDSVWR
jgi:hypothetical protein